MAQSAVSRRVSEVTGVAFFAASLLWLIALVSYSPSDPAWFFNSVGGQTSNFAGPTGAFLAEAAFQLWGYTAFLIPLLMGYLAWHYFWCEKINAGYTKLVGVGLMTGSVSGLLSLAFSWFDTTSRHFQAGGAVGQVIAAICASFLNRTGAAILLLAMLAFSIILSTQFSFGAAFTKLGARMRNRPSLLDRYREYRAEQRREKERQQIIEKHVKKAGREKAPARPRKATWRPRPVAL